MKHAQIEINALIRLFKLMLLTQRTRIGQHHNTSIFQQLGAFGRQCTLYIFH